MLGWLRTEAAQRSGAVRLTDPFCGQEVLRSATEEGFLDAPGGRIAFAVVGIGTRPMLRDLLANMVGDPVPSDVLDRVASAPSAPTAALSLEAIFHPFSVIGAGLQTFIVPIKRVWAAELVDPSLSRAQLFARSTGLALQREHVYYRSPGAAGGLTAPARILWYVSGTGEGTRAVRAVSPSRRSRGRDPARLYRRFAHLGVYSEEQVRAVSVAGRVMALRFARTRQIEPPIGLDDYRRLVARHRPGAGVAMVGPQPVPEQVFASLVR